MQYFNLGGGNSIRFATGTPVPIVDPDAQAFITAAAITNPTQQSAVNQLVVDLKGYGVWTKMKALYPFVGGTASQHKFNLKDPRDLDAAFRLVFNGGVTHSSNGVKFNGTNGYADPKINAGTLSVNNLSHGSYLRTTGSGGSGLVITGSARLDLLFNISSLRYSSIGNAGQVNTNDLGSGLIFGSRISSTSNKIYRNGILKSTSTALQTETTFGTRIYTIAALSGLNFFDSGECAFHYLSDGLDDTEAANLYTSVQTFQTTLNRNI